MATGRCRAAGKVLADPPGNVRLADLLIDDSFIPSLEALSRWSIAYSLSVLHAESDDVRLKPRALFDELRYPLRRAQRSPFTSTRPSPIPRTRASRRGSSSTPSPTATRSSRRSAARWPRARLALRHPARRRPDPAAADAHADERHRLVVRRSRRAELADAGAQRITDANSRSPSWSTTGERSSAAPTQGDAHRPQRRRQFHVRLHRSRRRIPATRPHRVSRRQLRLRRRRSTRQVRPLAQWATQRVGSS